jgi:hypothetical protein
VYHNLDVEPEHKHKRRGPQVHRKLVRHFKTQPSPQEGNQRSACKLSVVHRDDRKSYLWSWLLKVNIAINPTTKLAPLSSWIYTVYLCKPPFNRKFFMSHTKNYHSRVSQNSYSSR